MEPWWNPTTPRKEVREGRSFNPDEFAIALEQVVAGRAPEDYQKPEQFFSRTCFTRALCDNSGQVLRRLAGKTENTAPVQTLVTQMGGGKTHMLTSLWHLAIGGPDFRTHSSTLGNGVLLIFGTARERTWRSLPRFQANEEIAETVVIQGPQELAFPLHTQAVHEYFAEKG